MSELTFVKVIDSGAGWTTVEASDGNEYTFRGTVAWRANNPGNLRPGSLTNDLGAIGVIDTGSNGKFLIFPDRATGEAAQEYLQFETTRYADKTILEAISVYAPIGDNNDPASYAQSLADAAGVSVDTVLSDLTEEQRARYLEAQWAVEDSTPGTITGPEGVTVDATQFAMAPGGVALPSSNVPGIGGDLTTGADRLDTLDAPDPLAPGQIASPIQLLGNDTGDAGLAFPGDLLTAEEVARAYEITTNVAPTPMPGRPASLDTPAAEAAPVPMPSRPPDTAKTELAPAEQPQTVRIGKNNYTVGQTYETGGRRYVAQADGTFMDLGAIPTGEPTVMSGVIGQKIGEAATAAGEAAGQAWDNATTSVQGAASDIGTTVTTKAGEVFGGIGSGLTGLGASLGNLFGGAPPADGITVTQTGWRNGRPVMAVDQSNWIPSPAPIPETIDEPAEPMPVTIVPWQPTTIALPTTTGIPELDKALAADPILVLQDIHDDKETAQVQAAAPIVSTSTVTPTGSTKPPAETTPSPATQGAGALSQPSNWADFSTTMDTPSVNDPVKAQPVSTQTVTEVVPNPEYTDWAEKYGQVAPTPEATATLNDIHDARDDATIAAQQSEAAVEQQPAVKEQPPPAPPKTVVKTTTTVPATQTAQPKPQDSSGQAYTQPIYVSAVTGNQLYEQVVYTYNADTNTWGTNTVYKETPPDPNAPVPYTPKPPTMTAGEIANAQMGY